MKIAILQLLQRCQRDNFNPSLTAKIIYDLAFLWSNVQNVFKFNESEKISIPAAVSCEFVIFLRGSPIRFFYLCFFMNRLHLSSFLGIRKLIEVGFNFEEILPFYS
jgi:hypothetical protein